MNSYWGENIKTDTAYLLGGACGSYRGIFALIYLPESLLLTVFAV